MLIQQVVLFIRMVMKENHNLKCHQLRLLLNKFNKIHQVTHKSGGGGWGQSIVNGLSSVAGLAAAALPFALG